MEWFWGFGVLGFWGFGVSGYTDPEGSREYFGALVLGLYDQKGRLIHVGQVGTGFDRDAQRNL